MSAIVLSCLSGMFLHIKDFPRYYKMSKLDGFLWLGTFLSVLLTSAVIGLGIGVSLTILVMAYRNYNVTIDVSNIECIREMIDGSENVENDELSNKIRVLNLSGTISFANYESVIARCKSAINRGAEQLCICVSTIKTFKKFQTKMG